MPVLKSASNKSIIKNAVVLDMGDLERQARKIVDRARAEADEIISLAKQEAMKLTNEAASIGREQGFAKGIDEGLAQGREEGKHQVIAEFRPQLDELTAAWAAALELWEKDRAEMLLAASHDVLAFALEMGRKIVLASIEVDSSSVARQLEEALAHLLRPTAVTIAVHPDDRQIVEQVLPDLLSRFTKCESASLREEPSMLRGGCILSTSSGQIDASIETQIDCIVRALLPTHGTSEATEQ
jgi:flagellar assembly protein FliH